MYEEGRRGVLSIRFSSYAEACIRERETTRTGAHCWTFSNKLCGQRRPRSIGSISSWRPETCIRLVCAQSTRRCSDHLSSNRRWRDLQTTARGWHEREGKCLFQPVRPPCLGLLRCPWRLSRLECPVCPAARSGRPGRVASGSKPFNFRCVLCSG